MRPTIFATVTGALLLLLTQPVFAQLGAGAPAIPPAITNTDVIKMVQAGLTEPLILEAIRQAAVKRFDTGPNGLIALKKAGVSEAIIGAILNPPTAAAALVPVEPAPPATSSEGPHRPFDIAAPGIYLEADAPNERMIPLEPTVFSQAKSGGIFASAMTYGLYKAKWKAVVRSPKATVRVTKQRPTFYFVFEQKSSGLGNAGGFAGWLASAASPNEFVLSQMIEKRTSRELVVGEMGAFSQTLGPRAEDTVPFDIERVAPGIYAVTPLEDLGAGEFCFFYAAGAASLSGAGVGKLFDFGFGR